MNVPSNIVPFPTPSLSSLPLSASPAATAAPIRHLHRERDFGVGYGNSSGCASTSSYVANSLPSRFRFA